MGKNKHSVLIIGTGSLLNYGCESIVHGTYRILKSIWPDCSITVASDDIEYDSSILPSDVMLVKYRKRFTPYRIFRGILRRVFHIGNGSDVRMDTSLGKKYDIVLSCGGDNYCERPDYGIYNLLRDLMKVGANAVRKHNKYILWGASVGPFHDKAVEEMVIKNLSLCSAIFVREKLSYSYLSQFPELSSKLALVADPAFQMEPMKYDFSKREDKVYIGINMSELAAGHSLKDPNKVLQSKFHFAHILDQLIESDEKIELVFIPHVNLDGAQNDMSYLQPVYDAMHHQSHVHMIKPGLGARKTKGLIRTLDLLIAARMHCCVSGISVGTPTLFITYSNKGKGMSEYAYGHHCYEIDCGDMLMNHDSLLEVVKLMLPRRCEIKEYLDAEKCRFASDSQRAGNVLMTAD